jgi:Zn-dependent peptidase ImmA (M78 family)
MPLGVVKLDRMAIEEAGPDPERIAASIHMQLALLSGPVPIHQVAEALDIVEIRQLPLKGLEGALVSTPERDIGSIVVNSASSAQRQRFSVAHELGHFLNPWHKPLDPSGRFACRPEDLRKSWGKLPPEASHHLIQETEANRFAIEFLAPQKFVRPFLRGIPDLTSVLSLSKTLDLSREASAAVMSNSTTNPQAWCLASTALSAMSNGIRIFRPFYISLDSAYPNSRLRSTSPACPPTRKPTLATGWCGPAVTP